MSGRILGLFLTWLQDREGDVFVVATANDVSRLPPELLRKGRLDEIFFLDLPRTDVRRDLFQIHLEHRGQHTETIQLNALAEHSEGFTGADIEQVVLSAKARQLETGEPVTTETLMEALVSTRGLAQLMPEKIAELREWARPRTRSAD